MNDELMFCCLWCGFYIYLKDIKVKERVKCTCVCVCVCVCVCENRFSHTRKLTQLMLLSVLRCRTFILLIFHVSVTEMDF